MKVEPNIPRHDADLDFRQLVHEAHGDTIEDKLFAVFEALLERALLGDVPAAALLLDRLCGPVPKTINVNHTGRVALPQLGEEQLAQIAKLLDQAAESVERMHVAEASAKVEATS